MGELGIFPRQNFRLTKHNLIGEVEKSTTPLNSTLMKLAKQYSAVGALIVASLLAFMSFHATQDVTANILILIAQFLVYSLTLFGFGELAERLYKSLKK